MTLTLQSPAKVNLFLQIIRCRSDGYHELASLFQAIDLMDTLHFSLCEQDHLTCTDPTLSTDHSNLVLKAADLFRRKTGLNFGLRAHLIKKIPTKAGLGGGSGNAATTLWGLNTLLGKPASHEELVHWSGEIGSDITFFLSEGTAYCTGRGENLRYLAPLPRQSLWIIKPRPGTSTPAVYKKLDPSKFRPSDPEEVLKKFYEGTPDYFNDLEQPACEVLPELIDIRAKLKDQFQTVLLSGSGSSFFCMGPHQPQKLPGCLIFKTHFINRLPDRWYEASRFN